MARNRQSTLTGRLGRKAAITLLVLVALVTTYRCVIADGTSNLFSNPSFEEVHEPNQFGQAFTKCGGWVYAKPARLAVGTIARTGKYSYEMVADNGGKLRLQLDPVKLEPGRYRVKFYMRGLSIGQGAWGRPLDFTIGLDNNFPVLKKTGTFGWTPVTYVFETKKPFELKMMVGLLTGGWLWVDDVSLEKVGEDVDLTKEPVIGSEEKPVSPPAQLSANAFHCPECGLRNNPEWKRCFGCGHAIDHEKKNGDKVRVIADFEDGKPGPFTGGKLVKENAPQGKNALSANGLISINKLQDWSGYDFFRFDLFNPSDEPVSLYLEIRDAQTTGYWTRVNYDTVAPPGRSTVTLPTDMYVGEKSRPGRPLQRDKITNVFFNPKGKQLIFDNLRLERLDTDSFTFEGLQAFDFGLSDSPVMSGFNQTTAAMIYEPLRGFGWEKADLWRSFNAYQPDPLYQDFICLRSGAFRVDLPDGRYHVLMNIDSPGGYWGEVQVYDRRKVIANGKAVVDEKMDLEGFTKKYFRNAHREDLPGLDTFKEYVQPTFDVKEFDVTVSNGKLELKFEGQGFAISLSSLVIYPVEKAEQGKKFWNWVTERRRSQFNEYFKQIVPKRTGAAAPADGYRLFARHFMQTVNAFDGPNSGEEITAQGLVVTAAKGEEVPLTFSLQTSGNLGEVELDISDLIAGSDTHKKRNVLPSSTLTPGWLDYRISRVTMDGLVYTVGPRYWHPTHAPAAPGVTRTFWLRVKPPESAEAGTYRGTVTIRPRKGQPQSLPITVTVLPFKLDPITDLAVGPWGASIPLPWLGSDKKTAEWNWQMFAKSLDVLKEAGCTSFSGAPHLKVSGKGGRITLDTTLADKQMKLIREKGFTQLISAYGANISGYQMYGAGGGADLTAAKAAGFPDALSYLKAVYTAIDEHAVANNWLPVAWNLSDEPIGAEIKQAVENARAHRKAAEGLKLTTFMGATSMTGNNPKDPHYDLVKALLLPSLNLHDEGSLQVIKEAGNGFSFYNGGNRWTYGRYMKMLKFKHDLALRLSWHFNIAVGDPYYALDCREDDYSWYNTDANKTMVPSFSFLAQIMPGLNDYRYLSTLQRLLAEKANHPGSAEARKVFDSMMAITAGTGRQEPTDVRQYEKDRLAVIGAIEALLKL